MSNELYTITSGAKIETGFMASAAVALNLQVRHNLLNDSFTNSVASAQSKGVGGRS